MGKRRQNNRPTKITEKPTFLIAILQLEFIPTETLRLYWLFRLLCNTSNMLPDNRGDNRSEDAIYSRPSVVASRRKDALRSIFDLACNVRNLCDVLVPRPMGRPQFSGPKKGLFASLRAQKALFTRAFRIMTPSRLAKWASGMPSGRHGWRTSSC